MRKNKVAELDKLFNEVGTYKNSKDLKKLYEFIKRFPCIAPYNAMLIHIQKPGSQYIATASEWKKRFNRDVKTGANPLVILIPFGPVSFVFELGDTEGNDPFPKELINPFEVEGHITNDNFNRLLRNMKCDGVSCINSDKGTGLAGFIQTKGNEEKLEKIDDRSKEIWVKILYDMVINLKHPIETKFATIIHELGHLYCGHLGTSNEKWWKSRRGLDKNQREFEAESVCWLVCERMGIKNPSAEYLSGYLDKNDKIPNISIDTVLKAVGMIESMIKSKKQPRKEIIKEVIEKN